MTDQLESNGTLNWDHTDTMVLRLNAGNSIRLWWIYAPGATAAHFHSILRPAVKGKMATDIVDPRG